MLYGKDFHTTTNRKRQKKQSENLRSHTVDAVTGALGVAGVVVTAGAERGADVEGRIRLW